MVQAGCGVFRRGETIDGGFDWCQGCGVERFNEGSWEATDKVALSGCPLRAQGFLATEVRIAPCFGLSNGIGIAMS